MNIDVRQEGSGQAHEAVNHAESWLISPVPQGTGEISVGGLCRAGLFTYTQIKKVNGKEIEESRSFHVSQMVGM